MRPRQFSDDELLQTARRCFLEHGPGVSTGLIAEELGVSQAALFKRFKPIQAAMQREGWIWPESRWLAQDLSGKTLGLVGLGRIGRSVARMAGAFRMRVLAYDPNGSDAAAAAAGVERCTDLAAMLARCDAVSIHATLNPTSRHLIGAAQLSAMKPTAVLVNVSRGEIVDEAALLQALQAGTIAGAALDVYGREPLAPSGHPLSALYAMDNVLLWPHLTFYTHEAMQRLEDDTLARCFEALQGLPVTVRSGDPRLRAQSRGVRFED